MNSTNPSRKSIPKKVSLLKPWTVIYIMRKYKILENIEILHGHPTFQILILFYESCQNDLNYFFFFAVVKNTASNFLKSLYLHIRIREKNKFKKMFDDTFEINGPKYGDILESIEFESL